MENKKLLKEDIQKFAEISSDLKQFIPHLNELKSSYEALEIGTFTNTVFKEIVLSGPTKSIEAYVKSLTDQLDKIGIKNSIIRENAIKNHEHVIERFKKALFDAKKFAPETYSANRPKLSLKFISVNDKTGFFHISSHDKEMILESYCRIYLDSKQEVKDFEVIERLRDTFNEYLEIVKSAKVQTHNKYLTLAHALIINNENKAEISPEGVKGLFGFKSRSESAEQLRTR